MSLRTHLRHSLSESPAEDLSITGFVESAVLVALLSRGGAVSLLFIRRPDGMPTHAGQIGFPGGRREPQDESPAATALREAREELGITPETVEILGRLDAAATPVGFVIRPVCGWLEDPPALRPDPREVAEAFEIPLMELSDPASFRARGLRTIAGRDYPLVEYRVRDRIIWGATARIVQALLERLPGQASPGAWAGDGQAGRTS